jgi:HopA1 effector protein family
MGLFVSTAMDAPSANGVENAVGRLLDLIQAAKQELKLLCKEGTGAGAAKTNEQLANWLYANWYSVSDRAPPVKPIGSGSINLTSGLRASVASCSLWERGWVVMQAGGNGSCLAGHAGVTRPFCPGDYANLSRPGAPVVPGDNVAVMKRLDWVDEHSAFWGTQSIAGPPSHPLVRVYWSVWHDHIGWVLRAVVRGLDTIGVKYSLKCPRHAAEYTRVDALVVYLEENAWPRCRPVIEELAQKLSPHLRPTVPPLTLRLAPGVAFAEDGSETQSFGQSRCLALVPGVLAVLVRRPRSRKQGLSLLAESLEKNGINPTQPWVSRK